MAHQHARGGALCRSALPRSFRRRLSSHSCTIPAASPRPLSGCRSRRRSCQRLPGAARGYRPLPPGLSRGHPTVPPRWVRLRDQFEPLCCERCDLPFKRPARLLLLHANAVRVGPVPGILRSGEGRPPDAGGDGSPAPASCSGGMSGPLEIRIISLRFPENVRERIRRIYGRPADVIYPPVETARFAVSERDDGTT